MKGSLFKPSCGLNSEPLTVNQNKYRAKPHQFETGLEAEVSQDIFMC